MRLPKRTGRDQHPVMADTVDSVLTASIVVLLLACLGGLFTLISSIHFSLRVGDILVFKSEASVSDVLTVTATRDTPVMQAGALTATCTLDPTQMARGGGSLVVETKSLAKPMFTVHWAGRQTAAGAADCGSSADLTLSRTDLQTLVNAVGGFTANNRGNIL